MMFRPTTTASLFSLATRRAGLRRAMSSASGSKIAAPPMVYIGGEEMTHYCMELVLDRWIKPHFDTSAWEFFDLSCKSRDATDDKVLHDAVAAGARVRAIFKEPTITPTSEQRESMGLTQALGSPNGAMRRGWNGITISRDTIHIEGMELGYKRPVLFERHAVGGEYSAGFAHVGKGRVVAVHLPEDGGSATIVDERNLTNEQNAVVLYDNPLDNVSDLAHHFFTRCLEANVTPFVVTKKTVFKWQEGFWTIMKDVYDEHYKAKYLAAGMLADTKGELQHLISDAATMQIIRWTDGGFGMAAHNYDGDMLTDEVAQVHRSPGFITSNLIGKAADGTMIKEYEASHGTVTDMWEAHLRGEETSLNPLGLVEALMGAMDHAATLQPGKDSERVLAFTGNLRKTIHTAMANGRGTQDLCGPRGLTTEQFIDEVAAQMEHGSEGGARERRAVTPELSMGASTVGTDVDLDLVRGLFDALDTDDSGTIDFAEFTAGLNRLNILPTTKMISGIHNDVAGGD